MPDQSSAVIAFIESLETTCTNCNGDGFQITPKYGTQYTCLDCDGDGFVFTYAAERLFDFLGRAAKHSKIRAIIKELATNLE